MSSLSNFSTIAIPTGAIVPINAEGSNFHVVFAAADIEIKWPGGEWGTYQQGAGVDNLPNGERFKRLEIRNNSLGDILVTIYVGGPLYRDSRSAIIEPKTEAKGLPIAQIDATDGEVLTGVPTGRKIRRKSIQVSNLDPNLILQVRDSDENVILSVFPSTSITLPISEWVEVFNQNGSAIACNVSEIWWTI